MRAAAETYVLLEALRVINNSKNTSLLIAQNFSLRRRVGQLSQCASLTRQRTHSNSSTSLRYKVHFKEKIFVSKIPIKILFLHKIIPNSNTHIKKEKNTEVCRDSGKKKKSQFSALSAQWLKWAVVHTKYSFCFVPGFIHVKILILV